MAASARRVTSACLIVGADAPAATGDVRVGVVLLDVVHDGVADVAPRIAPARTRRASRAVHDVQRDRLAVDLQERDLRARPRRRRRAMMIVRCARAESDETSRAEQRARGASRARSGDGERGRCTHLDGDVAVGVRARERVHVAERARHDAGVLMLDAVDGGRPSCTSCPSLSARLRARTARGGGGVRDEPCRTREDFEHARARQRTREDFEHVGDDRRGRARRATRGRTQRDGARARMLLSARARGISPWRRRAHTLGPIGSR